MLLEAKKTGIPEEVVKAVVARAQSSKVEEPRAQSSKVEELNHKLQEIQESIRYFEHNYGMKTAEFYGKFIRGEAGDATDFFEWKARKELNDELTEERSALLAVI
jgi:hypothetical protein